MNPLISKYENQKMACTSVYYTDSHLIPEEKLKNRQSLHQKLLKLLNTYLILS